MGWSIQGSFSVSPRLVRKRSALSYVPIDWYTLRLLRVWHIRDGFRPWLLSYCYGLYEEGSAFHIPPLIDKAPPVIEACGIIGWSIQEPFPLSPGLNVERFGLLIRAHFYTILKGYWGVHIRMSIPRVFFVFQGLYVERFGLIICSHWLIQHCQVIEAFGISKWLWPIRY